MCQINDDNGDDSTRVRLLRCAHGTFHLNVGLVTLHLSSRELTLVGQAISVWAQRHPQWVMQMAQDEDL